MRGGRQETASGSALRVRLAPDERREQILDAASKILGCRPVDTVSLDDIASEAGITRALISHHFKTKRDLYLETVRRAVSVVEVVVPPYVHGATPEDRLRTAVTLLLDDIDRSPDVWIAALRSGGMGDIEVHTILDEARDAAVHQLVNVLGLGPADEMPDDELAVLHGWGAFAESLVAQSVIHGRLMREDAAEPIVDLGLRCMERILLARSGGPGVTAKLVAGDAP